jgi:predicted Zn-dependent protease
MVTEVNENDRGNMLSVTMKKPAVAVDPNVAINQELQRAQELLKTNDTAGARAIYLALMEKHPQVYQFPYFIATTYAAEKNNAKALEYVNIAAEKAPESVEVKLLKAEIMMDAGDKAGAKALLDGVDMTQVKDPFVFVNSAINMINDGQGVEAVALLDRVIAQFPTNHMLYYYRGRANLASQKLDEAKADLEKFVSMAPADTREVADAKKILEQMVKK